MPLLTGAGSAAWLSRGAERAGASGFAGSGSSGRLGISGETRGEPLAEGACGLGAVFWGAPSVSLKRRETGARRRVRTRRSLRVIGFLRKWVHPARRRASICSLLLTSARMEASGKLCWSSDVCSSDQIGRAHV